jgi:hypothetical protein
MINIIHIVKYCFILTILCSGCIFPGDRLVRSEVIINLHENDTINNLIFLYRDGIEKAKNNEINIDNFFMTIIHKDSINRFTKIVKGLQGASFMAFPPIGFVPKRSSPHSFGFEILNRYVYIIKPKKNGTYNYQVFDKIKNRYLVHNEIIESGNIKLKITESEINDIDSINWRINIDFEN